MKVSEVLKQISEKTRRKNSIIKIDFFSCGAWTQRGSWPPHSWDFLDHTQRRTTVGRTPMDECSARRRDLYLTTHNTHNRQTSMLRVGFEPTISAGERPQTHALGYGYIGARTDTTQQTNICLGIHCRNVWLHLNWQPSSPLQRHSNPLRTAASIWPECRLETNSLYLRQTVGGDNIPVVSVSV